LSLRAPITVFDVLKATSCMMYHTYLTWFGVLKMPLSLHEYSYNCEFISVENIENHKKNSPLTQFRKMYEGSSKIFLSHNRINNNNKHSLFSIGSRHAATFCYVVKSVTTPWTIATVATKLNREISGYHSGEDSTRGLLGCAAPRLVLW
jgi:hypothetical protein